MDKHKFAGFSIHTMEFLFNLRVNNNKTWFEENRGDYELFLLEPMRELVKALSGTVAEIDPAIETRPSVGKTISRIYRDTRFSNNKLPYRARMWISFRQPRENHHNYPGFYFELDPEYYCYGMGMYAVDKETMDRIRRFIAEKPDEFREAAAFYFRTENSFSLEGESYKRMDDSMVREDLKPWYRKKFFYLEYLRPVNKTVFSAGLAEDIMEGFRTLAPLYRLLYKIHGEIL